MIRKFKSVVVFLKILVILVLSRPFENINNFIREVKDMSILNYRFVKLELL